MGLWREHVVPRIADKALDNATVRAARDRVCADLHGDVLEIGFGSGLNVPHYPAAVAGVWTVDSSAVARRLGRDRVDASPVPLHVAGLDGQRLDLPDASFDAALSTYTLCTIPDVDAALREVLRVLKPGGHLAFVEHGRAPDPQVAKWQDRLEPIQERVAGGCHLDREIAGLIERAGFTISRLETYYSPIAPKPFSYTYEGVASRSG